MDVDIKQIWASFLVSTRFAAGTYGPGRRRFAWDAAAGARWNSVDQDIKVKANIDIGPDPGAQTKLCGIEKWVEPMIMLRAEYEVADKWTVCGRPELGGFGVNDDHLRYTVSFGAEWRRWKTTSLKFGYQFYGIDFKTQRFDGAFEYGIDEHGPLIGLTHQF